MITTLVAGLTAGCGTDDQPLLDEQIEAVLVGSLAARFDNVLVGGGVVAQGASLAAREDNIVNASAAITIAGIPTGATVQRALLYWAISGGSDTTATINSVGVTGLSLGAGGETCWAVNNSAFRADVTGVVTGNGLYTIAGLPSATGTNPDTDGVGLVVVYQQPGQVNRRRIMIRDGIATSTGIGETFSDTFAGVAAPITSAARFHLVVGDGQASSDGALIFNGLNLGTDQFSGSDGSLWDVKTYNITIPGALANATWSSTMGSDCLLYETAVLDYNVGVCGDGLRSGGEACENGNAANGDGCSASCDVEPGWTCTAATPSVCTPICGDGVRTGSETCDQGNTTNGDGCSATCQIEPGWQCSGANPSVCTTVCGDGVRAGAEQCDQGNTTNGDGCSATCQIEPGFTCTGSPSTCSTVCGDGVRAGAEQCDQGSGNTSNGDGCSMTCQIESGWTCRGAPSVCNTTCGDGIRAGAEACDDGDAMGGDGCSMTCTIEPGWTCTGAPLSTCSTTCGDGIRAGAEACDDGDTLGGDGCSMTCAVEPGWTCIGSPSACTTTCGDGIPAGAETCDDGDTLGGDGCSATCATEPGFTCTGAPSACTTSCGDGVVAGAETCDDSNAAAGDGCSATCTTEPGYTCTGSPSRCTTSCGDGAIAGTEACDDGGNDANDGCSATCTVEAGWTCTGAPSGCDEICGDGLVVGAEACDDGDLDSDDGCSATCVIEDGWSCTGEPSVCTSDCGDGELAGSETCDDGNLEPGDGCSAACATETGWTCTSAPRECVTVCGDAIIVGQEQCDDGNGVALDGCNQLCAVEDGWICDEAAPTHCDPLTIAGGGCAAGSGGGGLPLAAGLLMVAGLLRRRRGAASLLVLLAVASSAAPAAAQTVSPESGYSAERFRLAMDRHGVLGTENPRVPGHLVVDLGLWLGYANDPVTVRYGEDHDRLAALVHDRYGGDLVASIGLGSRLELGLAAPVILSQSDSLGPLMTTGDLSSLGFGDLALTPKLALLRGGLDLAVAAQVTLPTSGADDYFGEDGVTVAPSLLIGHTGGALRILANLGYRARKAQGLTGLDIDDELLARAGLGVRAGRADLMVEAAFATSAKQPFDSYNVNQGEVRVGLGVDLVPGLRLFGATGVGVSSGYGTPDWRALAGLWFGTGRDPARGAARVVDRDRDGISDGEDKCVAEPETQNGFEDDDGCPDTVPDADGDGILVPVDQCPAEPETRNGFEDDDGCPDSVPDSDGDGLSDPTDSCPDAPEDKDGFEDDDGCPDGDNDQDGVTDLADRCPMEPGVVENSGCPDTDRDGDTVVDRLDNCPDEVGTVKNHGCKAKQLVVFTGGTIELLDIVYFKTNKAVIDKRSFRLLKNVASVVVAHTEIQKMTVEGHTDDQGDDDYNKDLSQRRAQAVVDFLIASGVDANLLVPIGFGEERPIKDNGSKRGRAANRRVEFHLEAAVTVQTVNPLLLRSSTPPPELR